MMKPVLRRLAILAMFLFLIPCTARANLRDFIGNTWLKACLYDTKAACEENDCVWKDKCVLPDLPGSFCLDLTEEACSALHVCRWSGKRCVPKTPCAVKCDSFETMEFCSRLECTWDAEKAGCIETTFQNPDNSLSSAADLLESAAVEKPRSVSPESNIMANLMSYFVLEPTQAARMYGGGLIAIYGTITFVDIALEAILNFRHVMWTRA